MILHFSSSNVNLHAVALCAFRFVDILCSTPNTTNVKFYNRLNEKLECDKCEPFAKLDCPSCAEYVCCANAPLLFVLTNECLHPYSSSSYMMPTSRKRQTNAANRDKWEGAHQRGSPNFPNPDFSISCIIHYSHCLLYCAVVHQARKRKCACK